MGFGVGGSGCELSGSSRELRHHPARIDFGETIYEIRVLLGRVLEEQERHRLLSGLAAHAFTSSAQAENESRLVPAARRVHHEVLGHPVTEVSVLLGAGSPSVAVGVFGDHLADAAPKVEVTQLQLSRPRTRISWPV
jgi:hypothetical protein